MPSSWVSAIVSTASRPGRSLLRASRPRCVDNPRVIASYLGTDERAINRRGVERESDEVATTPLARPSNPTRLIVLDARRRRVAFEAAVTSESLAQRKEGLHMTIGIATGAGRGMGAACAERMADMVDVLVLVDRDEVLSPRRPTCWRPLFIARSSSPCPRREGSRGVSVSPPEWPSWALCGPRPCRRTVPDHGGLAEIITVNLIGTARLVEACRVLAVQETAVVCLRRWRPCWRSTRETSPQTPFSTTRWPTVSSRSSMRRSILRSRTPGWRTRGANASCTGLYAGGDAVRPGRRAYMLGPPA